MSGRKQADQMGGASSARAQTIRQGRVRTAQPAGVFKATSRGGYLYVRYVGGQS